MTHSLTLHTPRHAVVARMLAALLACLMAWPAAGDDDMARLSSHRLELGTLQKLEKALDHMILAVKRDPTLARRSSDDSDPSISDLVAYYDSKPAFKAAIARAGLSTEEFVVCMLAWVQASMAEAFTQSMAPAQKAKALSQSGVPPGNVDFVSTHKAYLTSVGNKAKALTPAR